MVEPICVAAYCAVHPSANVRFLCAAPSECACRGRVRHRCVRPGCHTLAVILPVSYDLVDNLDICISFPLRLANLLGVAAALGDEVLAVCPSISIWFCFLLRASLDSSMSKGKNWAPTYTSNMVSPAHKIVISNSKFGRDEDSHKVAMT